MRELPSKLKDKLNRRRGENALRSLRISDTLVDFASNDYLGFAASEDMHREIECFLDKKGPQKSGSTGSRLLTGNSELFDFAEKLIAEFHRCPASLIFNSGYDANLGFFSSVPQKGDLILYDELSHASIRDGIAISRAAAYKFRHNDLDDLSQLIERQRNSRSYKEVNIYVVTESVFSMDGDSPDLQALTQLCLNEECLLVVDEAHAFGILGERGGGMMDYTQWDKQWFARIVTFGKALGAHGAAIIGAEDLKDYLINFARSFIYTTALSPHSVASIIVGYQRLNSAAGHIARESLWERLSFFRLKIKEYGLEEYFIESRSAIHSCLLPGNTRVKEISENLREQGFDVRPILSPTVARGKERLRFCVHANNNEDQIDRVLRLLADNLQMG